MFRILIVATCMTVGAGATGFAASVTPPPQTAAVQTSIALNRLAANRIAVNRLAANRIAFNRLAANGISAAGLSTAPTSAGDFTPLVTIVAVTLADGTRLEPSAAR